METNSNNPEKQVPALFDTCDNCETKYRLTDENTAGRLYPKQPECSYLLCACPNCSYRTRIFVNETTLERAALNDIPILDEEDYAEPDIYYSWLDVNGIELIKTHELTDRHEDLIRKFGEIVINCPDELLPGLLTDHYPKTLPERWI